MAAGDAYQLAPATVTDTSYMTLQPSAGVEVVIHNIYAPDGSAFSIHIYDGTDDINIGSFVTSALNLQLHATNSSYVRVQNNSGASIIMSADGMTTK
jgi:hypothetical protein